MHLQRRVLRTLPDEMEQELKDTIETIVETHNQAKNMARDKIENFIQEKNFDKLQKEFLSEEKKGSANNEEQRKLIKETIEREIEPAYHDFKEAFEANSTERKMEALSSIL